MPHFASLLPTVRLQHPRLRSSAGRVALYADSVRQLTATQLAFRALRLAPPRLLAARTGRRPADAQPFAAGLGADRAPQSPDSFAAVGGLLFEFHLHGFGP